ncbi:MAG: SpoIIE family protein phosphatase [Ruminococcus sp.]|nr:SpoIIE family protein phosphatase [Ruminococcus sp.]
MKKIKKTNKTNPVVTLISLAVSFVMGFVFSGTDMAGVASFADISVSGALPLPESSAVLVGSLIHCIAGKSVGRNIVKISAMVLIVIAKMFYEPRNDPKINGFITALGVFVSGMAVSALIGEIPYKLIFYIFYGGLAGFTSYSLSCILSGLKKRFVLDFSTSDGCAYAIVYTVFIASLCSLDIPYINIGLISGITVTLTGAYYYRHTGGVICGSLTACGAFLSSMDCGMSVVLLPATALLTGYMNRLKNTTASLCFVGINFTLMVLTGITENSIYSMIDIICGAMLFIVISPAYSDKWIATGSDYVSALPDIISARSDFLSATMRCVRSESEKISEVLTRNNIRNITAKEVINAVCIECRRKSECWKNNYSATKSGFNRLSAMNEFSAESFPYELKDCLYRDGLVAFFRKNAIEKAEAKRREIRNAENMTILSEQFRTMEEITLSVGVRPEIRYSAPISKIVINKLNKFGFFPSDVIAYYNDKNRLHIEIYFNISNAPENFTRVRDLIADELKINLEESLPVSSDEKTRIRFFEKPEYRLEVYTSSLCADISGENGDTSAVFNDGTGKSYVIISDGMGNGKNASVESRMVVQMFRRLINSGTEYRTAVRIINSVMVNKSPEETFATLDAMCIDLDTCGLTVMKSGASATLIRHRNTIRKITAPTFPIGIYNRAELFESVCDFEAGDIIIMFSDGISENEYRFIKELLLRTDDIKNIVDEICAKADVFNPTVHSDDITVIGIRCHKNI